MVKKRLQEEIMKRKMLQNQIDIPLDIQEVIMKRLPVKSLIHFRSVSKSWKSRIDCSSFIAHYNNNQNKYLFIKNLEVNFNEKYVSIVDDDDYTFRLQKVYLPIPFNVLRDDPIVVGSSRGLLCFYNDNEETTRTVVLWNPSIRKSVVLDVPKYLVGRYQTVLGFGVCPRTHDPKLVKFTYEGNPWQVEVFSLSSGVWRPPLSINLPRKSTPFTPMRPSDHQVVIDGFIYWVSLDRVRVWHYLILSFDIASEEFSEIYLPDSLSSFDDVTLSISELRESLVVTGYNYHTRNHGVWMVEYGDPNSFTNLFNIKTNIPYVRSEKVLGFRKNGELLIELAMNKSREKHRAHIVYDLCSKNINYIGISGEISFVSSYMETLLLLDYQDCK